MDETACIDNNDVSDNDIIRSDTDELHEHLEPVSQCQQQHHHAQQQQQIPSTSIPLSIHSSPIMAHAVRLTPGSDFILSLEEIVHKIALEIWNNNNTNNNMRSILTSSTSKNTVQSPQQSPPPPPFACFIMTAVGSLSHCTLRMASAPIKINNHEHNHDEKKQTLCNDNNNNFNQDIRSWEENVEIVSLVGTIGLSMKNDADKTKLSSTTNNDDNIDIIDNNNDNNCWEMTKHLHMSISDRNGICYGGHFMNCTVFTTVEIVLGTMINGIRFDRLYDPHTGYKELVVSK